MSDNPKRLAVTVEVIAAIRVLGGRKVYTAPGHATPGPRTGAYALLAKAGGRNMAQLYTAPGPWMGLAKIGVCAHFCIF